MIMQGVSSANAVGGKLEARMLSITVAIVIPN